MGRDFVYVRQLLIVWKGSRTHESRLCHLKINNGCVFFTTMSLTLSDGCVNFALGFWMQPLIFGYDYDDLYIPLSDGLNPSDHYWYPTFGMLISVNPIGGNEGTRGQLYRGVALTVYLSVSSPTVGVVYNRSGTEQQIEFLEEVSGVANGLTGDSAHTCCLP